MYGPELTDIRFFCARTFLGVRALKNAISYLDSVQKLLLAVTKESDALGTVSGGVVKVSCWEYHGTEIRSNALLIACTSNIMRKLCIKPATQEYDCSLYSWRK